MISLPSPQQLRYLLALDEHRHFGRAAAACAVTQSTLSAGVLALERQLDLVILNRDNTRRVVFTPIGESLLEPARLALAALEAVVETAGAARAPMSGRLRLGVIPTIGPFLLPLLMPALRSAFPQLRLFLREDTTPHLLERLATNRLDLLLLALPCDCGTADTMPVLRDDFLVALPPNHRLAAAERIDEADLQSERMLLLEDGHCLRDQALAACGRMRQHESDGFAATSLHTLVQMVAGGLGITLLPRLAVAAGVTRGTDLVVRPLVGEHAWRTLGMAWRPDTSRAADYRALAPTLAPILANACKPDLTA